MAAGLALTASRRSVGATAGFPNGVSIANAMIPSPNLRSSVSRLRARPPLCTTHGSRSPSCNPSASRPILSCSWSFSPSKWPCNLVSAAPFDVQERTDQQTEAACTAHAGR